MVPSYAWPNPEKRAEQLAPVAAELVQRIRHEPVRPLLSELLGPLDGPELWAMVALLAAAVDPSVHPDIWWTWVRHRDSIEAAAPIVWDEDERPIEEMGSREISELIERLAGRGRTTRQIAKEIGMTEYAVSKRQERLRRQVKVEVAG